MNICSDLHSSPLHTVMHCRVATVMQTFRQTLSLAPRGLPVTAEAEFGLESRPLLRGFPASSVSTLLEAKQTSGDGKQRMTKIN